LVAIGVDEISWRRGQRYLTSVADHRKGRIVWCAPGRNAQTLQAFFDELGPERTKTSARHASVPGRPKVRGLSIAVQPTAQFAQRIGGQPTTLVNDCRPP
jgi:hypothetical protein